MKNITSLFFGLALLAGTQSFAATTNTDCAKEDHYPLITKADLQQIAPTDKVFIVDANSKESWDKNHIGTDKNAINFGMHKKDFATVLPANKDALIVAYCGGPACTAWLSAAKVACKAGYTNIKHFKGGISGWVAKD